MENQLPMSIFVDVDSLNKPTTFKLPMTKKQKFELELIMLTRKFNGEDNLNLKLMISQMIDQFIDLNRADYNADRGLRPQNSGQNNLTWNDCAFAWRLRPQPPKVFGATS
ncbi:MAG: hypothetical protein LWW88_02855 [Acinetobacter sp.]|uniref:hypothetical protein n=1 Tax=Acinetobacter sp. TaxID=472 RepID=UPI00258EE88B|nr:hypothetical protein [Acinetobacter sp.]MCE1270496.1 hypothetical protein [Acinetobacter sp.]